MSCFNWMGGALKMRPAQVGELQKLLITKMNAKREQAIKLINEAIAELLLKHKGKRNVAWSTELTQSVCRAYDKLHLNSFDEFVELNISLSKLVFPKGPDARPVALKQSQVPKFTSTTAKFKIGFSGHLMLVKKTGQVIVDVAENNHAVESAEESDAFDIALKFFNDLDWPRGGGGEIAGNDEYNGESRCSGGGANYTMYSFSYKTPKQKADEAAAKSRYRNVGYGNYPYRF